MYNNLSRSGPTYEAGSLETSDDTATSWYQRVTHEEAPDKQTPHGVNNMGKSNQFKLPMGCSRGRGRGLPFANQSGKNVNNNNNNLFDIKQYIQIGNYC